MYKPVPGYVYYSARPFGFALGTQWVLLLLAIYSQESYGVIRQAGHHIFNKVHYRREQNERIEINVQIVRHTYCQSNLLTSYKNYVSY